MPFIWMFHKKSPRNEKDYLAGAVSSATAPTSGQVLTATSSTAATWQTPSAGSGGAVVAVKSAIKTDTQSLAASTWTDVTGLSVTYTPTSASNKILVVASVQGGCSAASCAVAFRLVRNSTAIGVADAASNRIQAGAVNYPVQDGLLTTAAMAVLDSPATTASTVYEETHQAKSNGWHARWHR